MTGLETLEAAVDAARAEYERRLMVQHEELQAVKARHSAGLWETQKAIAAADSAVIEFKSSAGAHPWEGKRVYKEEAVRHQWTTREIGRKRVYGVVQVCRIGTQFAENLSGWSRPRIGAAYVRLEKKDGTLGTKIDGGTRYGNFTGWQLVEEA